MPLEISLEGISLLLPTVKTFEGKLESQNAHMLFKIFNEKWCVERIRLPQHEYKSEK